MIKLVEKVRRINLDKKNKKVLIFIGIFIIGLLIIAISIILITTSNKKNDTQFENISSDKQNMTNNNDNSEIKEEISNITTINRINYVEVEMPNLIGKSYFDIYYASYDLKDKIIEQLIAKDLEGTTFDINTLKYMSEGSINLNGYYVIYGYGYEVEKQIPEAGSKIKVIYDGEGNMKLEKDIYVYIKNGGETLKKVKIDQSSDENKLENNQSKDDNDKDIEDNDFSNSNIKNNEKQYTHTALSGCIIIDTNETAVTYKNKCENCDYISTTKKNIYHSSGVYTSSFSCPDCKKVNSIKIQTSSR